MKYKEFGKVLQEFSNAFYENFTDMVICRGNKYVYITFEEKYGEWIASKEYIKKYKEKHCNKK